MCVHEVHAMAQLMDSPEAAQAIAHHLEGPAFCQSEELGLDEDQVQECMANVRGGAVKGFQYIFKIVGEHARMVCHEQFGLCERPTTPAPFML